MIELKRGQERGEVEVTRSEVVENEGECGGGTVRRHRRT